MIKALIIDDEENCREVLGSLINSYCKEVNILSSVATVQEGIKEITIFQPDVVFLDIMMGRETGFDFLNAIPKINFSVIFTTAYQDFALKAFQYAALDYLLKPIDIGELKKAIQKLCNLCEKSLLKTKLEYFIRNYAPERLPHQLALSSKNEIEFISINEIVFCEADGFYTRFYLQNNKEIFVTKNLKEYEDMLPDHFFRVHKSYLINCLKVKKIIKTDGGYVIMNNGKNLPIAQRKKDLFLKHIVNCRNSI